MGNHSFLPEIFLTLGLLYCRQILYRLSHQEFPGGSDGKVGLVVLNSLSFYVSVKLFISLWNLHESLAGYSILSCKSFPFITLNIPCHSLLTCTISAEKPADNFMGIPLHTIYAFSLITFNIFSLIFVNLSTMPLSVFLPGLILPGAL